jgi:hypothetical protein
MGPHLRARLELVYFDTLFLKSAKRLGNTLSNAKNLDDSNIPTQLHIAEHALPSMK